MEKPTKIAICGLLLGSALMVSGWGYERWLERSVDRAVAACKAVPLTPEEGKPWTEFQMLCDPHDYYGRMDQEWVGEQKAVRDAIEARMEQRASWLLLIGFFVAVASSVPWLWYFMLRRLREVREALTGRT